MFALDEQAWQVFDQALSRPAAKVPGLREELSDASPPDPLHLFLLMKDLRKALETT